MVMPPLPVAAVVAPSTVLVGLNATEAFVVCYFTTTRPVMLSTTKLPLIGAGVRECYAFAREPPLMFKLRGTGLLYEDFCAEY